MERKEFTQATMKEALRRQKNKCGSCGTTIDSLGQLGQKSHKYGEGAHAHHMQHAKDGGTNLLSNCVILCESCHYSIL
jgi:5-methylcytosine-specific restriction endonuclease McrA